MNRVTQFRNGFEVQSITGKGRGLIASETLYPGTIILSEYPIVSFLRNSSPSASSLCKVCFKSENASTCASGMPYYMCPLVTNQISTLPRIIPSLTSIIKASPSPAIPPPFNSHAFYNTRNLLESNDPLSVFPI